MDISKKKALIVASVASMVDQFNRENIDILRSFGYEIDIAANFDNGSTTNQSRVDSFQEEMKAKGIGVFNVPITRSVTDIGNIIKAYRELKRIVSEGHYTLVHCQSPVGGVLCRKACKKARKVGTKVIYEAHGFHFFKGAPKLAWMLYYPIEKHYSRYTDVILTINGEDYERAQTFHAGKVERISGIGIHTGEIRNRKPDRTALRSDLGFTDNDFIFLSIGEINTNKNHNLIIDAMKKIQDTRVKYLLVGFGDMEQKRKEQVKSLGLSDRVIFAGYRDDVWDIVNVVDGFILPSKREGLPVALMEAMAAGLPVVCSRIRGNIDLIKDGEGGFLCDYNSSDEFAEKMMIMSEQTPEAQKLREAMGRTNADTMDNFDAAVVREQLKRIYAEAVSKN